MVFVSVPAESVSSLFFRPSGVNPFPIHAHLLRASERSRNGGLSGQSLFQLLVKNAGLRPYATLLRDSSCESHKKSGCRRAQTSDLLFIGTDGLPPRRPFPPGRSRKQGWTPSCSRLCSIRLTSNLAKAAVNPGARSGMDKVLSWPILGTACSLCSRRMLCVLRSLRHVGPPARTRRS